MRPPMPSFALSRRAKAVLWTLGVLIVLLIVLANLTGVYINWLWFGSLGYRGVYTHIFWTKVALFFIFGVLMALILAGNMVIAYAVRPPFRPMSPEQQNIERYRVMLEPRRWWIAALVAVIGLLSAGASAQGRWSTWLLFFEGTKFGVTDPQFHKDISFYAWDYPAYRTLLGFGFVAIIFALILSAVVHYLTGAIRLQTRGPKMTIAARRHITVLVFVFIVLKAIAYWFDRYGLVFSSRSTFTGASYTDVHAVLTSRTILFWISLVIAAGVLASMWLRSTLIPAIGFVSMLVLSIVISGIYPAILQQVSVKPNASSKEAPYIERNIQATRDAYGIQLGSQVNVENITPPSTPDLSALTNTNPTVGDIRILDPNVLSPTFTQQQQIRNVYGFADKLNIDRYDLPDVTTGAKQLRDYVVGVRELDAANLVGTQTSWINQHTVYTHGYGFVAAQANEDVTQTSAYTEGDIPATGPLGLKQPRVYYGELLPDYSIVGAKGTPQEYDASDGPKYTYRGDGGVSLGNFFTRLAFAVKYKQGNFVLNSSASAKGAKIIFNRDPRQMVQKVAPYLKVDSDPYPVVDSSTGDIDWVVDGYTTINNYPYSERNSLSALTGTSLSTNGRTARQPNDTINYIRNSVKAVVDAYTGKVTLYQWDTSDPVLKSWMKIFPGTVKPKSAMPAALREHIRYPEDLFDVQRSLIGTYHVSNPVTFYNSADKWTVPLDPNDPSSNQPPYYVLASAANADTTPSSPKFQLTSPMIVNGKQNLAAYVSVDSDPGKDYGKFTVLRVPSTNVTLGPEQVNNILTSNPVIQNNLKLLNTGNSRIVDGNLLTLPVGKTFLYVEPLYTQGTGTASYPILSRVLVVYKDSDHVGFSNTLDGALSDLRNGLPIGTSLTDTGSGGGTTPPPSGSSSPSSSPTTSSPPSSPPSSPSSPSSPPTTTTPGVPTLQQINNAYQAVQNAQGADVFAAQQHLDKLIGEYLQAHGHLPGSTGGGSGSPVPSGSSGG